MNTRIITLALLCALVGLPSFSSETGTQSTGHSATASLPGDPSVSVSRAGFPSRLQAALAVRNGCDLVAASKGLTGPEAMCELTEVDGSDITTATELLAQVPKEEHPLFMWRYQSNQATVYLAGSIHLLKRLLPVPEQYSAAFATADHLAVEVDTVNTDPLSIQGKVYTYGLLSDGKTLADVLPPETLSELNTHLSSYGVAPDIVSRLNPATVSQQLTVLMMQSLGFDPSLGVEAQFLGDLGDRDVIELETLDFQFQLLLGQPLPVQISLLEESMAMFDEIDPMLSELVLAWLSGNDAELEASFRDSSGDSPEALAFLKQLLDDRNVGMAESVKGFLSEGEGTYLVLVGAAHLVGKQGMVTLLEKDGIKGQRLSSNSEI